MDNSMRLEFSVLAENEAFARAAAAAFIMPLDPTVEELTEVKTCGIRGGQQLCDAAPDRTGDTVLCPAQLF